MVTFEGALHTCVASAAGKSFERFCSWRRHLSTIQTWVWSLLKDDKL